MFLDTSFNSLATVLTNIYESFLETATKMWTYVKCLPAQKRPGAKLVISRSLHRMIKPALIST
jgi:telomerase reverse transcriptase